MDAIDRPASQKYLRYDCRQEVIAGSNHQLFNLFALLAEASVLGRVAVVPRLTLAAVHNGGRSIAVPVSKYLDLTGCRRLVSFLTAEEGEDLTFVDQCSVPETVPTGELKGHQATLVVREFSRAAFRAPMSGDEAVRRAFHDIRSLAGPSETVRRQAEAVAQFLGEFNIVHVRRGDALGDDWWRFPGLDRKTRPPAIRRRISPWMADGCTLYIMSDETQPDFFEPLKKWYRVVTYRDFPALVAIKGDDNYLLYEIEKHLASKATIRVEMFNDYPQYGRFKYSLFDYPRGGTTSPAYVLIGKAIRTSRTLRARLHTFWGTLRPASW